MYQKIYANLPFWSEKLPEIPDLIYDSLRQVKQLPEIHRRQFEMQQAQQQKAQRSQFYSLVGATLLICGAIFPAYLSHWWPSAICVVGGVLSWGMAITHK